MEGDVGSSASRWARRWASAEEDLSQAFSSRMKLSQSIEEGLTLATKMHLSPYSTGVFVQPPLTLASRQLLGDLGQGLAWNLIVAFLVYAALAARTQTRGAKTRGALAALVALLVGQSLGMEEMGLLLGLLGSSRGLEHVSVLGMAIVSYANPSGSCLVALPVFQTTLLRSKRKADWDQLQWRALAAPTFKGFSCWLVLAAGSTWYLRRGLRVESFESGSLFGVTAHWMQHTYSTLRGGADALTPNSALAWYLNVQMFPEMRVMFAWLTWAQPFLLSAPLVLELGLRGLCWHWLLAQVLVCNLFRPHYHLGTFVTEAIALCAFHSEALQGKFNFSLFVLSCAAAICSSLLFVTRSLWMEAGVGNSNFYWAMALAFNLTRLAISQSLLVQAREAPKEKKMKKR